MYTDQPQGSPHHPETEGPDHCADPKVDKMHSLGFGFGIYNRSPRTTFEFYLGIA